jgi:hypothetical protein
MIRYFNTVLLTTFLFVFGCAVLNRSKPDEIKHKFDLHYASWMKECEQPKVRISSSTWTYTNLPSFHQIVELGRPALPYIKEKMEKGDGDFMLAYAVIEILGWKRSEFPSSSEQEFRDMVLERMESEKIAK